VADAYEWAVIRVVPDVVREEFVNVGAVVFCDARGYLGAASALDPARLVALAPDVDVELVRAHVDAIVRVCGGEGPMGALPIRERFRWIVAPRNAIVQTSCAHGGATDDPEAALAHVLRTMVLPAISRPSAGRR
jgi:hypothetical protein